MVPAPRAAPLGIRCLMTSLELTSSLPPSPAKHWRTLGASLRENSLILLYAALIAPVPYLVAHWIGVDGPAPSRLPGMYFSFAAFVVLSLFCCYALWYIYHSRIARTPGFRETAWRRVRATYLTRERILLALPPLLLWPVLASGFSFLKSIMPLVQPFYLDPALVEIDRALHFGVDPWRLLAPLLNHAPVTFAINGVYMLWIIVFNAVLVLQCGAAGNRKLRLQFLVTMALAWTLVGNLAATLMSSAGPCYYHLVVDGPNPFTPLMTYLHSVSEGMRFTLLDAEHHVPLTSVLLQDVLWQSQMVGDHGIAKGISAAPSMHVASTWIIFQLCLARGRRAALFGGAFLLAILVGSVHLGWHYATDGYTAIILSAAIWWAVGRFLDVPAVQRLIWPKGLAPAR